MKVTLPSKRAIAASIVALTALIIPERSDAVQLTYELRIDPATTSPGVVISNNFHTATATAPGQVIGLQIYADIDSGKLIDAEGVCSACRCWANSRHG